MTAQLANTMQRGLPLAAHPVSLCPVEVLEHSLDKLALLTEEVNSVGPLFPQLLPDARTCFGLPFRQQQRLLWLRPCLRREQQHPVVLLLLCRVRPCSIALRDVCILTLVLAVGLLRLGTRTLLTMPSHRSPIALARPRPAKSAATSTGTLATAISAPRCPE